MLSPDTIGLILYVIATLVAYLLFHFYKHPLNNGSNTSETVTRNSSSKKKFGSKSSLEKAGKSEQFAPVTGNRSANKILSSGRYVLPRQQSDTCLLTTPSKWFPTVSGPVEEDSFERYIITIIEYLYIHINVYV